MQKSEKQYKNLFEKFPDAVFFADTNYQLADVSPAIKKILGYDEISLTGKSLLDLLKYPEDAGIISKTLADEGKVENFEVLLLSADGKAKMCSLNVSVENGDNDREYLQGSVRDISNLKKAEESFLRLQKLAASGRFISTLAHELRNPLNNIKLAVENLLQTTAFSDDDLFFLNIIQRNGERINDLVTELLNSSRPAEINPEQISLHQLLDNVSETIKPKLQEHQVTVIKKYQATNELLSADPDRLAKAILNIMENAIEAIQHNKGIIEITTANYNDQLCLNIKDNGSGITDASKDKIFELYFTSKRNSIGLGLATTLNILQSHNAKAEVQSQEKEGTTFSIHFSK